MKRAVVVWALTVAVVLPAAAQSARGQASAGAAPPPGWDATKARVMDLGMSGKNGEMLALMEPIVAKSPDFVEGLFWFGAAHENIARELARTDPKLATTHFEAAATAMRRVYDLGGGANRDAVVRGLIDLYEYALPRPDTRKALILDARTRYAAEPVVHWYFAQLLITEGRVAELPAAFKAARAALPATPPDTRLEFASLLAGLAERTTAVPVRTTLADEAEAYANETLKLHPTGFYSRRAQGIKDQVARLR